MFEVGKKVICIKSHSAGLIKKGQIFLLHSIRLAPCRCGITEINIGITTKHPTSKCGHCYNTYIISDGTYWLSATLFAPYDDSLSSITVEQLIEELSVQECDATTAALSSIVLEPKSFSKTLYDHYTERMTQVEYTSSLWFALRNHRDKLYGPGCQLR